MYLGAVRTASAPCRSPSVATWPAPEGTTVRYEGNIGRRKFRKFQTNPARKAAYARSRAARYARYVRSLAALA